VIFIVGCCHSMKVYVHAARAIATKWNCDQDVKAIPGASYTKRCDWCRSGSLQKDMLLKTLSRNSVECTTYHEWDVR